MEIGGALSEVFAAFDSKGGIDEQKTTDYIKFLIKNGVSGLFVGGIAAETLSFSSSDREKWLKAVKSAVGDKIPVIVQLRPSNLEGLAKQIKSVEDNGADIISLSQPYPIPLSSAELIAYFKAACGMTKLPVMVYNEPTIGKPLDLSTLNAVIKENKNIRLYKDSTHNMIDLHSLIMDNPSINVLAGSDGLIFDIMNAGGSGVVSLVINPFPEIVKSEVEAVRKGDIKEALSLQNRILRIRSILKEGGLTGGYRYAMELKGVNIGEPRFPYAKASQESKSSIKKQLEAMKLV